MGTEMSERRIAGLLTFCEMIDGGEERGDTWMPAWNIRRRTRGWGIFEESRGGSIKTIELRRGHVGWEEKEEESGTGDGSGVQLNGDAFRCLRERREAWR
ncbi:hypothetical protein L484_022828 [Morus notabilis]|uniref:Uncharacterized protein n=1 Tax=Morus notabilis TaxID=981085 RepID=W9S563_9ROSA|nr:hypothetical protein L484_022828 [Morus notabilis]